MKPAKRRAVFVVLHGVRMRVPEAAELCGVALTTVGRWEAKGRDVTELAEKHLRCRWMREQARKNGVAASTARNRWRRGWQLERAARQAA